MKDRYSYSSGGTGLPAWCSPCIDSVETILIVEGELNGMAAFIALEGQIGVMGTAGTNGSIWTGILKGRCVLVYADDDPAGQAARDRWAREASDAGAKTVLKLPPLESEDFCDVAARGGLETLKELLT